MADDRVLPLAALAKLKYGTGQSQLLIQLEPGLTTLKDISVLVQVNDQDAKNVVTKPNAAYSLEKRMVLWRLPQLMQPVKMLA